MLGFQHDINPLIAGSKLLLSHDEQWVLPKISLLVNG